MSEVQASMTKQFKVTNRAVTDAQDRGNSPLGDMNLRTLIEDVCFQARADDKLLPPFETINGQQVDFFVRMDADQYNGLEETLFLLVTEDSYDRDKYAVIAGWTGDYYSKQKKLTGLGGGLRHRPHRNGNGFSLPQNNGAYHEPETFEAPQVIYRPNPTAPPPRQPRHRANQ